MALLPETVTDGSAGHLTHSAQMHRKLNAGFRDVKADFGAVGDGVADDTTAVQAALAAGGVTFFPLGTYLTGQLTLPHAAVLRGVNSGTYNNTFDDTERSRLRLRNGANSTHIVIPTTSNRVIISDLEFDGNKGNQVGSGFHGLTFIADAAQNESQAVVERCYIHDHLGCGIYQGVWRQANHYTDCIVNFSAEHGMLIIGTDNIIISPICGDNAYAGIALAGNVNMVIGGAIYNNEDGIAIPANIRRVSLIGNGIDKNLKNGVRIDAGVAGIAVVGNKFTSNGRLTNNTYGHINVQTATGFVTLSGNSFSGLEPGVTNQTAYAVLLGTGCSALDAGNNYESGSVGGFSNAGERLYVTSRPTFRESQQLWMDQAVTPLAEGGLNLALAKTELDVTFAGTRRLLNLDETGREAEVSVRGRRVAGTGTVTMVVSICEAATPANVLCSVTVTFAAASSNITSANAGVGSWTALPAWFNGPKTVAVFTQVTTGGAATDDYVFRDITLKWRG